MILFLLSSFNFLNAKNLQADFQYFTFQNKESKPYIETYFSFLSTQINYIEVAENTFQGSVLIELTIKNGEEITQFDKYLFKTPLLNDTLQTQLFIDKQIYALENGAYTLDLSLLDPLSNSEAIKANTAIIVDFIPNKIQFSDFLLLDSYHTGSPDNVLNKSGYNLIPSLNKGSYFFDDDKSRLDFYIEWYNTEIDSATSNGYLLNYYIENEQSHIPITGFNSIKRKTKDKQKAFLGGFNIADLPTGNYNLVVAILDKNGLGKTQKRTFFQRRNTKPNQNPQDYASIVNASSFVHEFEIIEQLAEHISSLLPIASQREWSYATNQLKLWDIELMKQFFHGFWYNRNPLDPKAEWLKYLVGVNKANDMYSSTNIKGFATDRGRVFLKYGSPDNLENSIFDKYTLPYQIWTYNKVEEQTNKTFVFVENAMGTNDYELIHSTVRGEKFNPNWRKWVYRDRGALQDLGQDNRDMNHELQNTNLDNNGTKNATSPGLN